MNIRENEEIFFLDAGDTFQVIVATKATVSVRVVSEGAVSMGIHSDKHNTFLPLTVINQPKDGGGHLESDQAVESD